VKYALGRRPHQPSYPRVLHWSFTGSWSPRNPVPQSTLEQMENQLCWMGQTHPHHDADTVSTLVQPVLQVHSVPPTGCPSRFFITPLEGGASRSFGRSNPLTCSNVFSRLRQYPNSNCHNASACTGLHVLTVCFPPPNCSSLSRLSTILPLLTNHDTSCYIVHHLAEVQGTKPQELHRSAPHIHCSTTWKKFVAASVGLYL